VFTTNIGVNGAKQLWQLFLSDKEIVEAFARFQDTGGTARAT